MYKVQSIELTLLLLLLPFQVNEYRAGTQQKSVALKEFGGDWEKLNLFVNRNRLDLELYEYAKSFLFTELLDEALDRETMIPSDGVHTSEIYDLLSRFSNSNRHPLLLNNEAMDFSRVVKQNENNASLPSIARNKSTS